MCGEASLSAVGLPLTLTKCLSVELYGVNSPQQEMCPCDAAKLEQRACVDSPVSISEVQSVDCHPPGSGKWEPVLSLQRASLSPLSVEFDLESTCQQICLACPCPLRWGDCVDLHSGQASECAQQRLPGWEIAAEIYHGTSNTPPIPGWSLREVYVNRGSCAKFYVPEQCEV